MRRWLTLVGVLLLASRVVPAQGPTGKLSGEGVTTDVVYGHKAGIGCLVREVPSEKVGA
jgi:hypothetical protein